MGTFHKLLNSGIHRILENHIHTNKVFEASVGLPLQSSNISTKSLKGAKKNNDLSRSTQGTKERNNPSNPVKECLKHLQAGASIFTDSDFIFEPTNEEIQKASKLFEPDIGHKIQFLKGAYYPCQAPDYNLPEVAFIGRSNVGKSSLIKAIFKKAQDLQVRTSKRPGLTKLLLFFQAGKAFSLVDMPGYGFNQPENFTETVEEFLPHRKNLLLTYLLIDSQVGFQPMDFVAIEMLEEIGRPYAMVLTKSDKGGIRQKIASLQSMKEIMDTKTKCCLPQPFLVSAHKLSGVPFLQAHIAYITGKLKLSER